MGKYIPWFAFPGASFRALGYGRPSSGVEVASAFLSLSISPLRERQFRSYYICALLLSLVPLLFYLIALMVVL